MYIKPTALLYQRGVANQVSVIKCINHIKSKHWKLDTKTTTLNFAFSSAIIKVMEMNGQT